MLTAPRRMGAGRAPARGSPRCASLCGTSHPCLSLPHSTGLALPLVLHCAALPLLLADPRASVSSPHGNDHPPSHTPLDSLPSPSRLPAPPRPLNAQEHAASHCPALLCSPLLCSALLCSDDVLLDRPEAPRGGPQGPVPPQLRPREGAQGRTGLLRALRMGQRASLAPSLHPLSLTHFSAPTLSLLCTHCLCTLHPLSPSSAPALSPRCTHSLPSLHSLPSCLPCAAPRAALCCDMPWCSAPCSLSLMPPRAPPRLAVRSELLRPSQGQAFQGATGGGTRGSLPMLTQGSRVDAPSPSLPGVHQVNALLRLGKQQVADPSSQCKFKAIIGSEVAGGACAATHTVTHTVTRTVTAQ